MNRIQQFADLPARKRRLLLRAVVVRIALWALPLYWVRWSQDASEQYRWNCRASTLAGHDTEVHVGVAKDAARGFDAHAWVEYCGVSMLGDDGDFMGAYLPSWCW